MIDLTTAIVREYETALRRQAAWRAAAHRIGARFAAVRNAYRGWLAHGEIGRGYEWRGEQPGSGWQYVCPNGC